MNKLKRWIDYPCIDPGVFTLRERLVARYKRWRFVWDTIECFYDFANNLNIKGDANFEGDSTSYINTGWNPTSPPEPPE